MRHNGTVSTLLIALCFAATLFSRAAFAADHPIKMATEAYFSVRCDAAVGQLTEGRPELGSVTLQRINWLPEAEQPSAYFAKVSINHFSWRELAISFVPKSTGTVTLELYGPWEKNPDADIYRQDVWWDDVRVTGAELKNGGFEQPLDASDSPWKSTGGIRVPSSTDAPSAEGQYQARTWHNERLTASIAVQTGQRITVQAKVRSVRPDGFVDMRRNEVKQTPAHQAAKLLRRGANLGNHLEVAPDQNWAIDYSDDDYEYIRAEGFDHVRLPVGWQFYTGPAPDFRLSDTIFSKVDQHIERAQKRKLAIIVNIHHFDDFTSDPVKQQDRFLAIWKQIAERYHKLPDNLFFELLNEPKDAATTVVMNSIYVDAIKLIRRSNPTRTILVGPGHWNSIAELPNLKLPDDELNLIVSVHNYDPFHFTHQGASWAGPDVAVKGIRFPGPPALPLIPDAAVKLTNSAREWLAIYNHAPGDANPCSEATLRDVARTARNWSDYYGRPIHFGEFGAFVEADAESRANFVRGFRQAFADVDLGWAIWDWKAGFRYWDADHSKPSPGFRDALFPPKQIINQTTNPSVENNPKGVNCSTLTGKVMCGYQGWHAAEGDGCGRGWYHWTGRNGFKPGSTNVDLWPDVTELDPDERYTTAFQTADGKAAEVYSAFNAKTVIRHFQWTRDYGIDGVFLQRFAGEVFHPPGLRQFNTVLNNCREGANKYGRTFAVMYDLSGISAGQMGQVVEDWKLLTETMQLTKDPSYLHHNGKPVVAVWGFGFSDGRKYTLQEGLELVAFLKGKEGGENTVMLGVPTYWRTLQRDAVNDKTLLELIAKADIVSPWTVGRYTTPEQVASYSEKTMGPDIAWCKEHSIDYLPVVFPGFSWHNQNPRFPINSIPRLGGKFLWSQFVAAKKAGAKMVYQAMFDEVDEGTAIYKCTNNVPVGESTFATFDGLPSDFYLKLVGAATKMLRGDILLTEEMPALAIGVPIGSSRE